MISTTEIITRLLIGAVFGGIIGFERHIHGRAAGFRTHLLVCVASVLVMMISEYHHYLGLFDPSYVRADPGRIAAGAITGVGFIGAGVIVKMGFNIQGLTTAACVWIVSIIGLAVGSGLYTAGTVSFVITYVALWFLRLVEDKMPALSYKSITVVMEGKGDEESIVSVIKKCGATISNMDYERNLERKETHFSLTVSYKNDSCPRRILDDVSSLGSVKRIVIGS
ncbi:MAG TPA: MgtC/SapB family protein [Thermodesulfovibrionales bacterium]|nr:MgtC/SapB family protein [Thermodesulfovibrionales bacterium]